MTNSKHYLERMAQDENKREENDWYRRFCKCLANPSSPENAQRLEDLTEEGLISEYSFPRGITHWIVISKKAEYESKKQKRS